MIDPTKAGRRYDLQFKQDAVGLVQSGKAIVEPDLRGNFNLEIGCRLIQFWEEQGKKRWLETDPNSSSRAE